MRTVFRFGAGIGRAGVYLFDGGGADDVIFHRRRDWEK